MPAPTAAGTAALPMGEPPGGGAKSSDADMGVSARKENGMERTRAILVDITKCIGCRSCEQACKELHGFPKDTEAKLSPTALTVIEEHGDKYVRRMCMHCEDPACASACLVGALKKTALGPVTYDGSKCIGCRYCLVACPFSVPRYEWTKLVPFVKKCDMCAARQMKGQPPACVEACPTGASIVGWRDEILEEAERRILGDAKYVKHIYGSEEAGGTSVFFISDVPFEKLGFVAAPRQPMPALSAAALNDVPTVVLVGGSLLAGLYWITERRNEVARVEAREKTTKP
jgi:formate dehydrogenase iron-sulfur subunit